MRSLPMKILPSRRGMRSLPMKSLPSRRSTLAQLETKSKFDPKFLISQNSSFWIQDIYEALFKQQQEICATNMSQIIVNTSGSKYGDHLCHICTRLMCLTVPRNDRVKVVYVYLKCSYSQNMRIIFMTGIGTQVSQQC